MKHALALLLLAACSCGTSTATQRREQVIQAALDAAYLACQTALNDPNITWDKGAREYCLRVTGDTPECRLP